MVADTQSREGPLGTRFMTVIIATKDRARELETISLPSLARQDTRDFEVIVWDASKDDRSEQVVRRFGAEHPGIPVRYFRAPRVGSCAQRNDAVKEARGDIIFFIDDDSEVSPEGINALSRGFEDAPHLGGAALPLNLLSAAAAKGDQRKSWTLTLVAYWYPVFALRPWHYEARVLPSAGWWDRHDVAGDIDHLMGCGMAFRKTILQTNPFNERMQEIAPYALFEDVEMSHRIWRRGHRLAILEGGKVTHYRAKGGRTTSDRREWAMRIFNRYLIWRYSIFPFSRASAVAYGWSLIGELGAILIQVLHVPWRRKDLLLGTAWGTGKVVKDILGKSSSTLNSTRVQRAAPASTGARSKQ